MNRYETDSDKYWKSTSYFTPIRGQTYGSIKRRKSMYFSLKFVYYGKTVWDEWENILRIGEYGNGTNHGCEEHGDRYPALFVLPSNDGLQVSLSDTSDCWFVLEKNYILKRGIIYSLVINYNQTHSTISVSKVNQTTNKIMESPHLISNKSRTNNESQLGTIMDIIISDPLTQPANVHIFDMMIISYDDVLRFPQPNIATTPLPASSANAFIPVMSDVDVEVTIAMDYASNYSNVSSTNEVIRKITEDIMNRHMDKISNASNASNTSITVVIDDMDPKPYDVILKSNYSTNNATAVYLEAVFENLLETEILEIIGESNNGSITIRFFDIEIAIVPIPDAQDDVENTSDVYSAIANDDDNNMLVIWYISVVCIAAVFCVFIIGFYFGYKVNDNKQEMNARRNRLRSQIGNAPVNDADYDLDLGNIQIDGRLAQSSEDGEYDEDVGYVHKMSEAEINDIRHTIYSAVMDMNHIYLQKIDDEDIYEDEDIEDLYEDKYSDEEDIYEKPSNDTNLNINVEGAATATATATETAHVAIPYYHCD